MGKILSVSIAGYNVQEYIEEALRPFARDDFKDTLEVFVIDDGGADSTLSIAQSYAERYPEIFIPVHKENGGWGSTVNYGITHATGKYFKQLDGDDFFNPDNMSAFLKKLASTDADMIYTPFLTFEDGTNKTLSLSEFPEGVELNKTLNYEAFAHFIPLAMHSCTFKTSMLRNNNVSITEKCFYTDIEFVMKAVANVETFMLLENDIYQYRIARSGQSMSYPGVRKHYKEHLIITKSLVKFLDSIDATPNKMSALQERVQYLINNQYSFYFILMPNRDHKKELRDYDKYVREKASDYYEKAPAYVKLARKCSFNGYTAWVGIRYINHIKNLVTRGY